jgi:hypothetical protein
MKRYFQDKKFGQTAWTTTNEKVTHNFPFHLDIPKDTRDSYIKLREYETLFSIAHQYLGDEHLWWVLIIANKDKGWRLPWDAATYDIVRIPFVTKPYLESLKAHFIKESQA